MIWEIISMEVRVDGVHETQFLAMHEGQCVGRVGVKAHGLKVATVRQLYVAPEHRGKGLGKLLVNRCLELAAQCNCWAINLSVAKDNRGVLPFYYLLGFKVCVEWEDGELTMSVPLV